MYPAVYFRKRLAGSMRSDNNVSNRCLYCYASLRQLNRTLSKRQHTLSPDSYQQSWTADASPTKSHINMNMNRWMFRWDWLLRWDHSHSKFKAGTAYERHSKRERETVFPPATMSAVELENLYGSMIAAWKNIIYRDWVGSNLAIFIVWPSIFFIYKDSAINNIALIETAALQLKCSAQLKQRTGPRYIRWMSATM